MKAIDNRLAVETPEGVEFELEYGGLMPRAGAFIIDLVLRGLGVSVMATALGLLGGLGQGLLLLVIFGAMWLYMPLFEVFWGGKTPGKHIFGLKVVHSDGTRVGWYGSVVRNLLRVADGLPVGYPVGVVAAIVSGRFQRLGDLAADTVVIVERRGEAMAEARRLPPVDPIQLSLVLTAEEQQAVVAFAERFPELGRERSAELAGILKEALGEAEEVEAVQVLHGAAQRIVRWG